MEPNTPPLGPNVKQLHHVANTFPLIDHHAHSLLLPAYSDTVPFETITTDAQGRALRDTFKSLSHLRASGQLRQLYECGEDVDWEDILQQRTEWLRTDPERLNQRCFQGIHALLVDDGLAGIERVFPYEYHDRYTKAPCRRIIRIETVAEHLMERIVRRAKEDDLAKTKFLTDTWVTFTEEYERAIQEAIEDPEVAGFKTVICYRTGLDIQPEYQVAAKAVGYPFERYVKNCVRKRNYRIEKKALNDYIVLRALEILSERAPKSDLFSKPLQLHTGLGDNDISLLEANPAFLQPLMENYPTVPFVLLHAAYPYTREAGYLATVYRHVFLDIGQIFPMLSRDGQGAVLQQAMELVPGSKLMYSSAGRWFPETFWLANIQFRQVWFAILCEKIETGDLTPFQAIGMTKDILFNNANTLYDLRYEAAFDERLPGGYKQLTLNPKNDASSSQQSPIVPLVGDTGLLSQAGTFEGPAIKSVSPYPPPAFPPPPKAPQVYDINYLDRFRQKNTGIQFIYMQWTDYAATICERIVPMKEFDRIIRRGERLEVSQSGRDMSDEHSSSVPVANAPSPTYAEPDLRSLRVNYSKDSLPAATVQCYLRDVLGNARAECPRSSLESLVHNLQYSFSTTLLVGWDIEVTFLSRDRVDSSPSYTPLGMTKAWGEKMAERSLQVPFVSEIALALAEMEIEVQQLYADAGPGQYTFALAPLPASSAVDSLIQARQVIQQIAGHHELRATLHPRPCRGLTAAVHARLHLQPSDRDMQFFVGGVLQHLRAICAFSLPGELGYDAVNTDGHQSKKTWSSWSTQACITPLRRISPGNWVLHTFDGLANMYLALASLFAAGLLGLQSTSGDMAIPQQDVPVSPSALDDAGRHHYGIVELLPRSLPEALDALERDGALQEAMMAHALVGRYVGVKEMEMQALARMGERERHVFCIQRC